MDERDRRIAELLEADFSQQAIGRALGISGPAVSQRIARQPALRRLRTEQSKTEKGRLQAYRSELQQCQVEVDRLRKGIQRSIDTITEELSSYAIDELNIR